MQSKSISNNSRVPVAGSRREQFENQLRELQRDIGSLSDKLKANASDASEVNIFSQSASREAPFARVR